MFRSICVLLLVVTPCTVLAQNNRLGTRGGGNESLEAQADWNNATKLSLTQVIPKTPPNQSQCVDPDKIPLNGFGLIGCWYFEVGSIINDDTMLITIGKYTYWMEGYSTKLLASGEKIRILDPVQFVGMKDYNTVLGAGKRVRHFKVMTKAQQLLAERAKREEDAETWIVDGKELKARFVCYKNNVVILEDAEGEMQKHRISQFDPTSAAKIRDLVKKTVTPKKK